MIVYHESTKIWNHEILFFFRGKFVSLTTKSTNATKHTKKDITR
jgi:hypothetical protein